MVMRKFKKSLDSQMSHNSAVSTVSKQSTEDDDIPTSTLPTPSSTPKLGIHARIETSHGRF